MSLGFGAYAAHRPGTEADVAGAELDARASASTAANADSVSSSASARRPSLERRMEAALEAEPAIDMMYVKRTSGWVF